MSLNNFITAAALTESNTLEREMRDYYKNRQLTDKYSNI